jgi:hypothetical protein
MPLTFKGLGYRLPWHLACFTPTGRGGRAMGTLGTWKRVAGLIVIGLLMPGGIPLLLAALAAGRLWRDGLAAFAPRAWGTS